MKAKAERQRKGAVEREGDTVYTVGLLFGHRPDSFSNPKSYTFLLALASWLIWAAWYLTELTQAVLLALWRAARVVYVQAVQILFPDKLARRSLRNSRRKVLTAYPPPSSSRPPPSLRTAVVPFSRRYFKLLDGDRSLGSSPPPASLCVSGTTNTWTLATREFRAAATAEKRLRLANRRGRTTDFSIFFRPDVRSCKIQGRMSPFVISNF